MQFTGHIFKIKPYRNVNRKDRKMADTGTTIRYWILGSNEYPLFYSKDGAVSGAYAELLEMLESSTGIKAERVSAHDGTKIGAAEAIELLKNGELDVVLGLPAELAGHIDMNGIEASPVIYGSELTAVIKASDPQVPADSVDACFWGIDVGLIGLTEGTALDGHTLDFNTEKELFEALDDGSIYGALVRKSGLDYEAYIGRDFEYRQCPVISIPYGECAYMRAGTDLAADINDICEDLAGKYLKTGYAVRGENGVAAQTTADGYLTLLADSYSYGSRVSAAAGAGITAALILGILAAVLAVKMKKTREKERVKLMTMIADNPAKELFELDLKKRELYAYDGFATFRQIPDVMTNPVSLEKLSKYMKYDFVGHYASVGPHSNTNYHNRLIIHVAGEKLYLAEDGHRIGDTLLFTMTNIREADRL